MHGRRETPSLAPVRRGFIHRDVKPSNFCCTAPKPETSRQLLELTAIDFGLARRWRDQASDTTSTRPRIPGSDLLSLLLQDGSHVPPKPNPPFRGSVNYASVYSLQGEDQSRRDDLWSLLYILVELVEGHLPWRAAAAAAAAPGRTSMEAEGATPQQGGSDAAVTPYLAPQRQLVAAIKAPCLEDPSKLCPSQGTPPQLYALSQYLRTLAFEADPDYGLMRRILRSQDPAKASSGNERCGALRRSRFLCRCEESPPLVSCGAEPALGSLLWLSTQDGLLVRIQLGAESLTALPKAGQMPLLPPGAAARARSIRQEEMGEASAGEPEDGDDEGEQGVDHPAAAGGEGSEAGDAAPPPQEAASPSGAAGGKEGRGPSAHRSRSRSPRAPSSGSREQKRQACIGGLSSLHEGLGCDPCPPVRSAKAEAWWGRTSYQQRLAAKYADPPRHSNSSGGAGNGLGRSNSRRTSPARGGGRSRSPPPRTQHSSGLPEPQQSVQLTEYQLRFKDPKYLQALQPTNRSSAR